MQIVTTETIQGKKIKEVSGIVQGSVVTSKNIGRDIGAGLKSLAGGELKDYTKMQSEAREIATNRMIEEAEALGANAIVGVRYATSTVMSGASEFVVYGTAVKVQD